MLVLPALVAVALLRGVGRCRPSIVFWGFLAECAVALVFCRPIGAFLGYRLESFAWDLFGFLAYGLFVLGWAAAATLAQLAALALVNRVGRRS